jgi:hypothetical protein
MASPAAGPALPAATPRPRRRATGLDVIAVRTHRRQSVSSRKMTDSEDHAADEWRYACMSRPYVKTVEKPKPAYPSGYRPYRSEKPADWLTF